MKKKLAINSAEADIVREIFTLYVHGKNGPRMGMKEIAKTLNAKGILNRGKFWRVQKIQNILSSSTYAGWHVFNMTDSKTFKIKDQSEWVKVPVPAIIDQDMFEQASKLRNAHMLTQFASRRETSPNLLTGLLKCDCCGATMVQITAKRNRYRYYKCSNRLSKGNAACQSTNYPMAILDTMVLDAFRDKIYTPEYIRTIIDELRRLTDKHGGEDKQNIKKLETELKDIDQAEAKLFEGVEMGVLELNDRLKTRIQQHQTRRDAIVTELATLQRKHQSPLQTITPQKIEAASRVLKKRFSVSTPFSRAYLKATVSEMRIKGDLLKLRGERKTMANLIAANGMIEPTTEVHRFIKYGTPSRICRIRTESLARKMFCSRVNSCGRAISKLCTSTASFLRVDLSSRASNRRWSSPRILPGSLINFPLAPQRLWF